MDVNFFLTERTRFIQMYYDKASAPFRDTIDRIEAGDPPFEPPYSEDGEPPFLAEWMKANDAEQIVGRTCVSMLSDSLKIYFQTWEGQFRISCRDICPKAFKRGFVNGYRTYFEQACKIDWSQSPIDLDVLEQIVHARNDSQHPSDIHTWRVPHRGALGQQDRHLIFATEVERATLVSAEPGSFLSILGPEVRVSRDSLFTAIEQVERFAAWFDEQCLDRIYRRKDGH